MAITQIDIAGLSASGTTDNSTFLRGDNTWAAPSGGATEATQTNMEGEATGTLYTPPDLIKHSPGVAKAWTDYSAAGTPGENIHYNIASYSDVSVGVTTISILADMDSGDYVILGSRQDGGTHVHFSAASAGSFRGHISGASIDMEDGEASVAIFGVQV